MSWTQIGIRKPEGYDIPAGSYYHHDMEMGYELWSDDIGGTIVGGYSDAVGLVTWYYASVSSLAWIRDNCDEVEQ